MKWDWHCASQSIFCLVNVFLDLKKISFFIYNVFIAHHKTIQDSLSDQFSDLFFFLFQFFQSFVNGFVKSVRWCETMWDTSYNVKQLSKESTFTPKWQCYALRCYAILRISVLPFWPADGTAASKIKDNKGIEKQKTHKNS